MGDGYFVMAIRTTEQFIDRVAQERAWRIKELSALKSMLETSHLSPSRQTVLNKSCVALLYAHWEGFVKKSGNYFLEYVAMQRMQLKELKPCFISLILKSKIDAACDSKKYSVFGDIAGYLVSSQESRIAVPYKNIIDTQSNLSSSVLREILACLGLDYSGFEPKQKLIDSKLVNRRNYIAHGEDVEINTDDVKEMFVEVLSLMDDFRTLIENSVVLASYKRTSGVITP